MIVGMVYSCRQPGLSLHCQLRVFNGMSPSVMRRVPSSRLQLNNRQSCWAICPGPGAQDSRLPALWETGHSSLCYSHFTLSPMCCDDLILFLKFAVLICVYSLLKFNIVLLSPLFYIPKDMDIFLLLIIVSLFILLLGINWIHILFFLLYSHWTCVIYVFSVIPIVWPPSWIHRLPLPAGLYVRF